MGDNIELIICIPDTKECASFIEQARKGIKDIWLLSQKQWLDQLDINLYKNIILFEDNEDYKSIKFKIESRIKVNNISYIIGFSEKFIDLVSYLYIMFNIVNPPFTNSKYFRDKYIMRQMLTDLGLSKIQYNIASCHISEINQLFTDRNKNAENESIYSNKVILKPRSSWACQGVMVLSSLNDVKEAISNIEDPAQWILEEYVNQPMFGSCALVFDKKIVSNITFSYQIPALQFSSIKSKYPCFITIDQNSKLSQKITDAHQKIITNFGLNWGMSDLEIFYDEKNDEITVCEVACRHPSHGIVYMHQALFDHNPLYLLAKYLTNKIVNENYKWNNLYSGLIAFISPPGTIKNKINLKDIQLPGIYHIIDYNVIGKTFKKHSLGNILSIGVVRSENYNLVYKNLQQILNSYYYQIDKYIME